MNMQDTVTDQMWRFPFLFRLDLVHNAILSPFLRLDTTEVHAGED